MKVFAFVDLSHPAVAWAVMRGKFVSAEFADERQLSFISFMLAGIIECQNNTRLHNEIIIEYARDRDFREKPSRLRCVYFFGMRSDAEARIGDPDWPSYFRPENLVEFELRHGSVTEVDANWITHAPRRSDGTLDTDNLEWISRYWSGEAHERGSVWEHLFTGIALVTDEKIRRECHDSLVRDFPDSHIPMLMARLASEVGTQGGR